MLRKLFGFIVLLPLAIVLIAFAVANRTMVTLSFDPTSAEAPLFALQVPLFLVAFVALAFGILIGGIAVWASQGRHRRASRENRWKARRYEREATERRAEVERLTRTPALPAPEAGR